MILWRTGHLTPVAMETQLFALVIVFIFSVLTGAKEIRSCQPPSITKHPKRVLYFPQKGDADLVCVAPTIGNTSLRYTWLKDGVVLNTSSKENAGRMTIASGVGSLMIHPAIESDAGNYQCKVQNPCGTSLSVIAQLHYAFIEPFPKLDAPEKKTVGEGRSLKLECNPPRSVPKAKVSWILLSAEDGDESVNGAEDEDQFNSVILNERITMDYSGNLYFVYVKAEDVQGGKRYVCMASNNEVRSFNQGEDKIVEVISGGSIANIPPTMMWHSPRDVLELEGSYARFKCIFAGNPAPTVKWERLDGTYDDKRMNQSSDGHEFIIKDSHPSDAGTYRCSGINAVLKKPVTQDFHLRIESRPKFVKTPRNLEVGVEDNVTINCDALGQPEPKVEWFINGIPIKDAPEASNRQLFHNQNILVFTNVSQSDSQVIQCNASNEHGYLWADIALYVIAVAPEIHKKPVEQKVAKDWNVTIICEVQGKPKPRVQWYKGSQPLEGARYKVMDSGDLVISSVTENDSGQYACFAINRFGEVRAEAGLIVRGKTQIRNGPVDNQVTFGESALFKCGAITDPQEINKLHYKWFKNGVEISTSDPRIRIRNGDLVINSTSSKDTGKYMCVASNGLDSDNSSATLKVKAPPEPPHNISIISCSTSKADIGWQFTDALTNFSPLERFILEFNSSHQPDKWKEVPNSRPPAEARQSQIDLSPWATYTFRVRAVNGIGVSEPSSPTHTSCKTPESRPFRHPHNVKTDESKTGFLIIEWEPMPKSEHNGENFKYIITWQADGEETVHSYEETNGSVGRKEIEVGGIYKPYTIKVSAKNSIGEPYSPAETVRGFSGEAAPIVVPENFEIDPDVNITATSAGFRWDPVETSPEKMRGKFQGYQIRYWKKNQKNTTLHEELIVVPENRNRRATFDNNDNRSNEKIRGKVSNLPSFSEIEADVVVANSFFTSQGSNIISFTTPEGVPDRVEYLEALFRGSKHFLVEWGAPTEPNGVITGYELGYRKISGLSVGALVIARDDLGPNQQRTTIDGLEPDSLYRIYIWARTAQGKGRDYFIDVRTTGSNSTLAVPIIKEIKPEDHSANITWTLPHEKGVRTGFVYYLEYRKQGNGAWEKRDQDGATDHFWLTLDRLEPGTAYEVRVVSVPEAVAEKKEGLPSKQELFKTTGIGAKRSSVLSAGWFIGMMVAIAILLLILIIVCIVKRNRGKEYKFPPEKDTVDEAPGHFNEMAKSDKNGVGGSSSFDRDPEKVPLEEETDSLEDYGDVDPTKFNEDGSFIGQYGSGKGGSGEPTNASAMSAIV